jgi:hypothetical protein
MFWIKSLTMAAATAMRCEHSTDGGIQWLRVKPRIALSGKSPGIAPPHPAIHLHFSLLLIRCLHIM